MSIITRKMQDNINDLITRILSGESSPQDNLDLISWLNQSQENIDEFYGKERVLNAINVIFAQEKFNEKDAYGKFIENIDGLRPKQSNNSESKRMFSRTMQWAAIGLLLIGFGSLLFYFINDQSSQMEANEYELIVPVGSRGNLILTDGTSVWLNAGSRLSYSKNFGKNDRSVHLEGEGYFEVERESKYPFTVIASEVEVTALGTSFNIKSYPDEDVIQTTLVSGSININRTGQRNTEKGLTLEPNQQLTYYRETRQLSISAVNDEKEISKKAEQKETRRIANENLPRAILSKVTNPEIFTSWKDNRLILDDEPFESLAIKLERRFGTTIIIKDEDIRKRRFKGSFDEITMEQALTALQFVSPFHYSIENDTIYISSK
jgi:transmembrane sensor